MHASCLLLIACSQVSGLEPSPPLRSWQEIGHCVTQGHNGGGGGKAAECLLQNLAARGFAQPTPIQRQAIPTLMASRELLAVAPTGDGVGVKMCGVQVCGMM